MGVEVHQLQVPPLRQLAPQLRLTERQGGESKSGGRGGGGREREGEGGRGEERGLCVCVRERASEQGKERDRGDR